MSVRGTITPTLLGILCFMAPTSELSPDHGSAQRTGFGDKERFTLVSLHNKLRGNVRPPAANMRRMVWSEVLGHRALEVSSRCEQNAPEDPQIGWNLQRFPAGTVTPTDAITLWFRQGDDYNFITSECSHNRTCRHYTQLVRGSSWQLGCGMRRCSLEADVMDVVVCAYAPGGDWNIQGHLVRPYQPGPWCSLCTAGWSGCFTSWEHRGGLCEVPRSPCRMSCGGHGTLNTSSCQCVCAPGFTGRRCQVRCGSRCVHGHHKEEECTCVCDTGYGGALCTEELKSSALPCDLLTDGVCFMVSSERRSYYKAKKICQEAGGHLAEIRTQKTQDILAFYLGRLKGTSELMDRDTQTRNFWIGLTYRSRFSSFRWDSGNPATFQSFALGQPDSAGFGNCVEMSPRFGFNWNDQRCKIQNRYICQDKI